MTTATSPRIRRLLDIRGYPIAIKLGLGLGLILIASGLITDRLVRQVVQDAQADLVLDELQSLSRSQAFGLVDAIGQELIPLSQFALTDPVQTTLRARAAANPSSAPSLALDIQEGPQSSAQVFDGTRAELEGVTVLDAQGVIVGTSLLLREEALPDPGSWSWFQAAYNAGAGSVTINQRPPDSLALTSGLHIALPVYDKDAPDQVIGVIYTIWNLSNAPGVTAIRGRQNLVFSRNGAVVLASDLATGQTLPDSLTQNFAGQNTGSFTYVESSDARWWYGFSSFADLGIQNEDILALDWVVATRQLQQTSQSDILALTNRLRVAIGLSSAVVTLAVAFLAFLLLRPLRRLAESARRIGAGQLDTPIPHLPSDEIGNLSEVMRELVSRLLGRVRQMDSAVQISRMMSATLEVDRLLESSAEAVAQQFGYPEVCIYLVDRTGRQVHLRAAAGAESQRLLEQGGAIPVNESSLVGRAVLLGETQIDSRPSPLFPAVARARRPEIALALRAGGMVLGALHVILERSMVLEQQDIDLLALMADQLSASIQNARLFDESRANVVEIEALNRRLTRQAWEEYLAEGSTLRHTLDPQGDWPEIADQAGQLGAVTVETYTSADGRSVLAMPLALRGERIGTLAVSRPPGSSWTRDEVLLVEAVGTRLSMIAEGIRLVEESAMRAYREQTVNEVSAQLLQRAASVDGVLQSALDRLNAVLGSDHISLRIGRPPIDDEHQLGTGSASPDGSGNGQGDSPVPGGDDSGMEG